VEQEIAIAAFMKHVLDRSIPILFYKQAGVGLEGIRTVLQMNPRVEFAVEAEVLEDLKSELPSTRFTPFNSYDLEPRLSHRLLNASSNGDLHTYELTADVKNVGSERITDFEMRVFFPCEFLAANQIVDRNKSTETHACFTAKTKDRAPDGLYPGDGAADPLRIQYFVDRANYHNRLAMACEIIVKLFSGSMKPKERTFPIIDFQDF